MATYQINQDNPPTGAGYLPGDVVECPSWAVVPSWLYIGDEQWVPNDTVRIKKTLTGGLEYLDVGSEQIPMITLFPSGDTSFVTDSANFAAAITVASVSGGQVTVTPGDYWVKDVELHSGVAIVSNSLPAMNFSAVCPDLGLDVTTPFLGGVRFNGTGTEVVFRANTTARVATDTLASPDDVAVSGIKLSGLVGVNVASLITAGAQDHSGIAFSVLENLYGYKIKGTFIDLTNPQHVNGRNFKVIDGNHVFRVAANHSACQPGNSHFSDIYQYSWSMPDGAFVGKNTDYAILLETIDTGRDFGGNLLNYVTLNGRIQCNGFRDTTLNRTRGNCAIKIRGASLSKSVNLCRITGTDIEGKLTYGIDAKYATGLRISTDGWSNYADFVAGIKIKNSLQTFIDSNSYDTTLFIDTTSSVYLNGFVRYFSRDNNEAATSQVGKGIYTVFAEVTNISEPPTYTAIKTNGETFLQLGTANSYSLRFSESENVLRSKLIPFASSITPQTGNRTWQRWEASKVLLSGATTTQTLPLIDSKMDGVEYTFKSTDANAHTIATQSGQLIDGAATYALAAGLAVTLMAVATGTKWVVIAKA